MIIGFQKISQRANQICLVQHNHKNYNSGVPGAAWGSEENDSSNPTTTHSGTGEKESLNINAVGTKKADTRKHKQSAATGQPAARSRRTWPTRLLKTFKSIDKSRRLIKNATDLKTKTQPILKLLFERIDSRNFETLKIQNHASLQNGASKIRNL